MPEPGSTTGSRNRRRSSSDARRVVLDSSRAAVLDVLKAVRVDGAYANLVLPAVIDHYGLTGRDAAFTTEVASGTLRRRGTYDAVLAACVDRPLSKVEARVLDALRMGTHQLLAMRVPAHAALSTTVDLVRALVGEGAAGFANAVLRRVSEHDLDEWMATVAPDRRKQPDRWASVVYSHPEWIVSELRSAVGVEELPALLDADNQPPKVTLVARPGRISRDELPGIATQYSPFGTVLDGGDPGAVPAVADGRAGVQDEGSQLVAQVLADAPVDGPDGRWLDVCAGPGGKSGLLAGIAAGRGALLVAGERLPARAGLVRRTLLTGQQGGADYAPGVAGVVVADGNQAPFRPGSFDRVLVDAPCSGLGALRRRPEARWRKRADELVALVLLQRQLLTSALELVRPGGVVLYATCSPVLSETQSVVAAVGPACPGAVLEDAVALLPDVPDCAGAIPGTVQLWPHRHGTDAMFMALFRARAVTGSATGSVTGWPFGDLRIRSGDAVLRATRETDLAHLAASQPADYEHDPRAEAFPGEDVEALRRRLVHQDHWRALGTWSPTSWYLDLVVEVDETIVGVQSLEAEDFPRLRTVDSGSWLVPEVRGRGIGRAMRAGVLSLAFDHLGAVAATTSAAVDNAASLGVSAALGYVDNGVTRNASHLGVIELRHLRMTLEQWRAGGRGRDVVVEGLAPCLSWFGLDA